MKYEDFKKKIDNFKDINNCAGFNLVTDEDGNSESYFSHIPCDCCGRSLAGDRYTCEIFDNKTRKVFEIDICVDCLQYDAKGEVENFYED